jgi:hypothetical protein
MSRGDLYEALARTSQLINSDFFDDRADEPRITEEFRRTVVSIVADAANVATPAGQTAVTALVACNAMMGFDVDLALPDVPLVSSQPPLVGPTLVSALSGYVSDLIPGAGVIAGLSRPDVTYVIGDTTTPATDPAAIRVAGDDWRALVSLASVSSGTRWNGTWPIGPIAAAAAASAEGLRLILPRVAANLGLPLPHRRYHFEPRPIALDLALPGLRTDRRVDLGHVDFVSGGAITTAALYALLRVPDLRGSLHVIEEDVLDITNLNRYPLARRGRIGEYKAELLASFATGDLRIEPVLSRFTNEARASVLPFAPRVCVGVDDIPSRWRVQQEQPIWHCVGATSHLEMRLSTHVRGEPCAGCAHPTDDFVGTIPTISWVSLWAGLLQARELLAAAAGISPSAPSYWCWPFGLANRHGLVARPVAARIDCPVGCDAAADRRAA